MTNIKVGWGVIFVHPNSTLLLVADKDVQPANKIYEKLYLKANNMPEMNICRELMWNVGKLAGCNVARMGEIKYTA